MRHVVSLILPFVCLALVHAQTTTLTLEKANNTSACVSNGSPSYCVVPQGEQPALPLSTSTNNQADGAQTTIADAFPAHVSSLPVGQLMNTASQNWAGKVLCEYQPWFSLQTGYNGHIDIDYDENPDNAQNPYLSSVPNQDAVMISRGCNISFIDFYGHIDSSQDFNLNTTTNVYSDLFARGIGSAYPMQFAILEDENAFINDCNASSTDASEERTCIETDLENDLSYIYENYISPTPACTGQTTA